MPAVSIDAAKPKSITRRKATTKPKHTKAAKQSPAAVTDKDQPVRASEPEQRKRMIARQHRIAQTAYLRAQRRGFEPGGELEDWLEAEKELAQLGASGEDV